MIVRYNDYRYIDYSNITPEDYINASIECVQFADCTAIPTTYMVKNLFILNGVPN